MNLRLKFLLMLVACLCACTSTQFKSFYGKNDVFEGQGGTRESVKGIDIWENGAPPRKFKVIGFIDDNRLNGPIHMAMYYGAIAKATKKAGGDAAISVASEAQLVGMVSNGSSFTNAQATAVGQSAFASATTMSSSFVSPVSRRVSKFAVIKYIDSP